MQEDYISIETESLEDLARIVRMVDSNLTFIKDLHPYGASCRTLLVEEDGTRYVLKVRNYSTNIWDDTYFSYEIHALRRVAERNLSNMSYLVREYGTKYFHAILKTFAEGTPLNQLDHERLLKDEEFIRKLDALYLKLHLAGIAGINFQPRKIVVGPDDELTLVDLSTCVVNTESGMSIFSQEMREDSRFITRLEKIARKEKKKKRKMDAA